MKKLINKVLNNSIEGFECYEYKESYWIINPITNQWVVKVAWTGYTFYNYFFFRNLFVYMSLTVPGDGKYISYWLRDGLGFNVKEHCYPDYLPGEYDWSGDFEVDKVIECGEIVARRPVSLCSV